VRVYELLGFLHQGPGGGGGKKRYNDFGIGQRWDRKKSDPFLLKVKLTEGGEETSRKKAEKERHRHPRPRGRGKKEDWAKNLLFKNTKRNR